jgi:hypothetical protein
VRSSQPYRDRGACDDCKTRDYSAHDVISCRNIIKEFESQGIELVLPLFDSLYQGIELLVVGRLVENHPMKYFIMIADGHSSMYK